MICLWFAYRLEAAQKLGAFVVRLAMVKTPEEVSEWLGTLKGVIGDPEIEQLQKATLNINT